MISAESLRGLFHTAPVVEASVAGPPGPRFVVVACMDRRVQPEACLGLPVGGARVIRNAGGRVSDDALRSLIVAWSELDAEEFVVIHHTDCVVGTHTNQELQAAVTTGSGADAARQDFLVFTDPRRSVEDDVERIRNSELVPADVAVVGFVHDLDTGRLELVAGDPRSQLPYARQGSAPPRRAAVARPQPVRPPHPPQSVPELGDLAELTQLPTPAPVFQPATPAPRPPVDRPRRRGALVAVVGILAVLGFVIPAVVNQSSNQSQNTDVTLPTVDVSLPPVSSPPTTSAAPGPIPGAPVAPAAAGPIAFQDPLSRESVAFPAIPGDKSTGHTQFVGGAFQISAGGLSYTETPGDLAAVTGHRQAPTLDLEVTANKVNGGNAGYGIGCRLSSDTGSGYYLTINSDRNASITRWNGTQDERVLAATPTPSDVINPGTSPNVVRAVCTGAAGQPLHLILIVNGRTLLEATDTTQPRDPSGTIGVCVDPGAPNADGSPTTASFTNLTVRTTTPTSAP